MKIATALVLLYTTTAAAFVRPALTRAAVCRKAQQQNEEMTLEEEVEALVQAEVSKSRRMSNLRNEKGVEYAPWMGISPEDEAKIRAIMRERAATRRRRMAEQQDVTGNLLKDFAFQELSGTGLKYKVLDGDSVELEWATGSEANTRGFLVKRRPAKTKEFDVIASYETYGPLASKGSEGGVYRYLDANVPPGGWVYRVSEQDESGSENDLSQCLVEVQTAEEQRGALLAVAAFAVVAVGAVIGSSLLDPVQY
jgi:hypothetical protein